MSSPKAKCHDCKRPHGDEHGFPDLLIPDWAWETIAPEEGGNGLLCPSCICERLHTTGIDGCPSQFTSGPLVFDVKSWIR